MIRVIGEVPEMVKKTTCRHCAAQLEYTLNEVKKYEGKDYSGGSDGREWIVCPRCGSDVTLRSW